MRSEAPADDRETTGGVVRFAVGADGCGAMGCRVESPVYEAEKETGETRVLCLGHVREWLER